MLCWGLKVVNPCWKTKADVATAVYKNNFIRNNSLSSFLLLSVYFVVKFSIVVSKRQQ